MNSGIYQILNIENQKRYIGSSENLSKRLANHKRSLSLNKHKNPHLQQAWNKYGEQSFKFEILLLCEPQDLLVNEQMYFDFYPVSGLYNICLFAGNTKGYKHNEVSKEKISQRSKGNTFGKGCVHTKEHRRKISESLKKNGYKISEETKRKISEAKKGKPVPDERKERIKRTINSPEFKERTKETERLRVEKIRKIFRSPEYKALRRERYLQRKQQKQQQDNKINE